MILISTQVVLWILLAGASVSAYMVGRNLSQRTNDEMINATILYLVDNNLVRWQEDENGEIELLPLND